MSIAACYGLYSEEGEQIGFIAIRHFMHPRTNKIKMVHRLVILPDYQGIGIGGAFLNVIAELYTSQGYEFRIVTSARNLIRKLQKQKEWRTARWGVVHLNNEAERWKSIGKSHRHVKTASFVYRKRFRR